jgi:ferredoxin
MRLEQAVPKVHFVNELVTVEVPIGSSLRDAAIRCGIEIYRGMWTHLNCRGNGICGRCKVWVLTPDARRSLRERAHRVQGQQRLACQVRIDGDLEVRTRPLGPSTVVASEERAPAYLAEAERRLVAAREEAKKEAEKKAREAAKPKAEAKPKAAEEKLADPVAAKPAEPAAPAPAAPPAQPAAIAAASSEAKPG